MVILDCQVVMEFQYVKSLIESCYMKLHLPIPLILLRVGLDLLVHPVYQEQPAYLDQWSIFYFYFMRQISIHSLFFFFKGRAGLKGDSGFDGENGAPSYGTKGND